MRPARGFTLIELMVVLAIVAIASSAAVLALRDGAHDVIDREAVRLAALLEVARAQSRASGVPVRWQSTQQGFEFVGLPQVAKGQKPLPTHWLAEVRVLGGGRLDAPQRQDGAVSLVLGPEPMLPPQKLRIALASQPQVQRVIASDGLQAFAVEDAP